MPWEDNYRSSNKSEPMPWEDNYRSSNKSEPMPWEDNYRSSKTQPTPLPPDVKPSNAGGGRGVLGGPTALDLAAANPQQTPTPDNPMRAGAIGFSSGATLGLSKYPAVVTAWALDNAKGLMKNYPGMTFQEALKLTNDELEATRQTNPKSYIAGNVAGTVLNAATTGGATATVPQLVTRGAIQGGVSGFTNKEDLGEAAQGAALGGALGGVAGGVTSGVRGLNKSTAVEYANQRVSALRQQLDEAIRMGDTKAIAALRDELALMVKAPQVAAKAPISAQGPIAKRLVPSLVKDAVTTGTNAAVGAGIGFGANQLGITDIGGVPVNPWSGALGVAGYGSLKTNLVPTATKIGAATMPNFAPNAAQTGARATTSVLTATPTTLREANDWLHQLFGLSKSKD